MSRFLARSLVVVVVVGAGAVAVSCAPQGQRPPEAGGGPTPGPVTMTTGAAGAGSTMCEGGFGVSGGVGVASPSGAGGGFGLPTTPQVGQTHTASDPPPAISGGTLRITADGRTAIAADPDRDQVYVVDLSKRSVSFTVPLQPGDEPGRVTLDGAGRAHVALRRGGALVTIDPTTGAVVARRAVCAAPRGVAYEAANDLVHVACADGELVSLPAAGGPATRALKLDSDLRDVVVSDGQLYVTRFRTAELLSLDAAGAIAARTVPQPFRALDARSGQLFTPSIAWRTLEMPTGGGVVMVHQRGLMDDVMPTAGGYGSVFNSNGDCDAIVHTAVTVVMPGQEPKTGPAMSGLVVPSDMAVSADGSRVAIIAAGNATNSESPKGPARMPRVFVTNMNDATDQVIGCANDGQHGPCLPVGGGVVPVAPPVASSADAGSSDPFPSGGTGSAGASGDTGADFAVSNTCGTSTDSGKSSDPTVPDVVGQPIAVSFTADGQVVVQSREPAVLSMPGGAPIQLSTISRSDTGHDLFHANAGSGIACASCHAEGTEDGRTWTFACEGTRRTQSLQIGLKGTEPFHWGGDEKTFPQLVNDVFVGRMSGPQLADDQIDATLHWIDAQPRRTHTMPTDTAAVARGKALFDDTAHAGCASCHTGPSFTNNATVDVGTGGMFQVPSLVGIGTRGPYMHDGCAPTLKDRFGPCGGGDKHGLTSNLTGPQINDLIQYLDTL
jgi:hypothetical protein